MPSKSSRPKSALSTSPDLVAKLLQNGAVFKDPGPTLDSVAEELQSLRIITIERREFVKCAQGGDGDYPPKNRHCNGKVYLDAGLEDRRELWCSECERPVYPDTYSKKRFFELHSRINREGVAGYLSDRCGDAGFTAKAIGDGILRLDIGVDGVTVCVIEHCKDPHYLSRERAVQHPTCFVAVGSRDFEERFLSEEWVIRVALPDLLCGQQDLGKLVRAAAENGRPRVLTAASIPVCAQGPIGVITDASSASPPKRLFAVEVGERIVRIDGHKVIAEQAGPRLTVFRMLWQWFLEDLRSGLSAEQIRWWPLRKIIGELEAQTKKDYPDDGTVRKLINNLQSDIELKLRRDVGTPIHREDIIESQPSKGQTDTSYGYRINPFRVLARPFQPDLSQES